MSGWVPAGSDISDIDSLHEHAAGGAPPYRTVGPEHAPTPDEQAAVDEYVESWGRENESQCRRAA